MRIVAIRGHDLASLKGHFAIELDQPPLSNLGLFAIHGPVGAGKSTLLDAMTLALFGRTPRLSGVGGAPLLRGDDDVDKLRSNDPATLVRRGAVSAHAEVDFIGVDGRLYRARWEVRRARGSKGKPGKLQDEVQSLSRVLRLDGKESEERLGDKNTEVREIVADRLGLSFDELCRSVLLAQGGFQSFLQAKPNERAMLLEKVTGTDIYSRLSIAAYERGRRAEVKRQELVNARQSCGALADDVRVELQREVVRSASAAAEAEATAVMVERSRDRRAVRRGIDEATALVDDAERAIAGATRAHNDASATAVRARERQQVASPVLERVRHGQLQLAAAARADDDARAVAAAAVVRLQAAQAMAAAARQRVSDAEAREAQARAARVEREARVGSTSVAEAVAHALDALLRTSTTLQGCTAVVEAAARDVDAAEARRVAADEALLAAAAACHAALPEGVALDDVDAAEVAVVQALIAADDDDARTVLQQVATSRAVLERLQQAQAQEAARTALVDGEPCAVCGSIEHPWSDRRHDPVGRLVDEERKALAALEQTLQLHRERAARCRGRLQALPTTAAFTFENNALHDRRAAHLLELLGRFDAARPPRQALALARAKHAEAVDLFDNAIEAHGLQIAHREAANGTVQQARQHLLHLGVHVDDVDLAGIKERLRTLTADLSALVRAADDEQRTSQAVATARRVVVDADEAVVRADSDRNAADAVALSRSQQRIECEDAARAALEQLRALVDDGGGFDDVDALQRRWQLAVDDAERAAAAHLATLSAARDVKSAQQARLAERLERLEKLGGAVNDSDIDDDVLELRCRQARADAATARDAASLARASLNHDDGLRQRAADLDAELVRHDAASAVWIELAGLIGSADGARFRQFAQGLTLDALVGHANEHLTTLAPRYRLRRTGSAQQKHDLDLVVVDTEAGDDVRSTATLSGGESFLVSLALALGLSSLSANEGARGRVESLFIDEGFSALDQETLDVALAAFDALRQTGRQIGVISHVPLLVERLGAQVRVIPIGGGASRVEVHAG
jgi:exonuclease SbcC